ncbi:50S ribosomal protein L17 [Frankliniella fusca]|uniref:50S ribosomal protein L17 n=1 Tax=Frankliniella fusca TaxID=407009 RepID=A0AAE1HR72_9NEOP|nr:50S ribosomal protein L17 [Frankliniella fusca]
MFRVTISDEEKSGSSKKLVVMCKTTGADDVGRTLLQYFKSEEIVYNQVLPSMQAVARFTEPLPWPRCLYAKDDSDGRPCLVFEDLREKGFVTKSRDVVPDVHHFRLALSHLAKFHGAGMALQHLQPSVFDNMAKRLLKFFDDPAEIQKFEQFSNVVKGSLVMIEDRFPPNSEIYGKMKKVYDGMQESFMSMAVVPKPAPGLGIVHGDCHLNNLMFKYDKVNKVLLQDERVTTHF